MSSAKWQQLLCLSYNVQFPLHLRSTHEIHTWHVSLNPTQFSIPQHVTHICVFPLHTFSAGWEDCMFDFWRIVMTFRVSQNKNFEIQNKNAVIAVEEFLLWKLQLCKDDHMYTTWWQHQMDTFSTLLTFCVGNSPVNCPHTGQWCRAMMFSLICA